MSEKEPQTMAEFVNESAERYWYLSSIQKVARKYYKQIYNREPEDGNGLATFLQIVKIEKPEFFIVMNSGAHLLRKKDMAQKADEISQTDPTFADRSLEERIGIVQDALIGEFFELSTKAPRELRLLEGLLFNE